MRVLEENTKIRTKSLKISLKGSYYRISLDTAWLSLTLRQRFSMT